MLNSEQVPIDRPPLVFDHKAADSLALFSREEFRPSPVEDAIHRSENLAEEVAFIGQPRQL